MPERSAMRGMHESQACVERLARHGMHGITLMSGLRGMHECQTFVEVWNDWYAKHGITGILGMSVMHGLLGHPVMTGKPALTGMRGTPGIT